jgi:hypothetical protein
VKRKAKSSAPRQRLALPVIASCDDCGACCTEQAALPVRLVNPDPAYRLTGEGGQAVAVCYVGCVEAAEPIREAVEFRGEEIHYHPVETRAQIRHST